LKTEFLFSTAGEIEALGLSTIAGPNIALNPDGFAAG
jgi:hypothetical protein